MGVKTRNLIVNKHHYCVNCLAKSHDLRACTSLDTCRVCGKYHHTLLHPGIRSRLQTMQTKSKARRSTINAYHQSSRAQRKGKRQPSAARSSSKNQRGVNRSHQRTDIVVANQRILSEAIRSLAEVLCGPPVKPSPGGGSV